MLDVFTPTLPAKLITMKLPDAPSPKTEFQNVEGSEIPEQFALKAREDPSNIEKMEPTAEEKIQLRKEALGRQYTIIIDRSGSMAFPDKDGRTRWDSARIVVEALLPVIFNYDPDNSVPLYLFDSTVTSVGECTDASQIAQVFSHYKPQGSTNLSAALEMAMEKNLRKARVNCDVVPGTTFVVLLDGGADNPQAVIDVIKKYADPKNGYIQNDTQAAILFVQIADDEHATKFLEFLDDKLDGPDIVHSVKDDVCLQGPEGIEKALYDAIFD